ncbi:MAG TPA: ArsR family transcriptional regulator [Candidatus Bathyarchaeia archaeon]|nr:ArsR family transcriptional regulator [Candidatus Bathyarchaeia archaeon]
MLKLTIDQPSELIKVAHALSSEIRINILRLLNHHNLNINEIAEMLDIPVSTAAANIKVLENSGLILTELQPASRGAMKVCSRNFDDIHMILNTLVGFNQEYKLYEIEMPIGQYIDCEVVPTCGLASPTGLIVALDQPSEFFHPKRATAQILWFRQGYVEYRFPLGLPNNASVQAIQFSMELCSEAPSYDNHWPSDITLWVNGVEIGTWTSPGDFGDRRGKLNPDWWEVNNTQYGLLKTWRIDDTKSYLDNMTLSGVTLSQLKLQEKPFIDLKIGIKPDAVHKGGLNLFGKEFGDYPQDISMIIQYTT